MTPMPRRFADSTRYADRLPPASKVLDVSQAEHEDETLSEYGDRMRETYSHEYALDLLKTLPPTHTF